MINKVMKAKMKEFNEIGFGNQAIIPGGKYGAKRVELKDWLTTALSQVQAEARGEDRKYKEKMFIDATPDGDYALRLLRAYRDDCDLIWAETSGKKSKNLLIVEMNRLQKLRAKELNKAIFYLTKLSKEKKI